MIGMDAVGSQLEGLQALAAARTPEARQALFEHMLALVLDADSKLGAEERRTLAGLAAECLRFCGDDQRLETALKLAELDDPPLEILTKLALDQIEIAKPVLEGKARLPDDLLKQIAQEGSSAHLCSIAGRDGLTEAVTAEIAARDDPAAAEILATNQTAVLSEATLNRIATMSQYSETLAKALLARKDLTAMVAHRMFWWVKGANRRQILERHSIDLNELERAIADAGKNGVIKAPDHMAAKRLVDTVSIQSRMPVSGLIEIMRQGSLERFTWALCERLSIEFNTGKRIVTDPGGEALAVACRALRADKGQFMNLFLLVDFKRSKRARPASDLANIASTYDRVTHHRATASVALWDALERG